MKSKIHFWTSSSYTTEDRHFFLNIWQYYRLEMNIFGPPNYHWTPSNNIIFPSCCQVPVFLPSLQLQCIFSIIHCLVLSLCYSVSCSSPHPLCSSCRTHTAFAGLSLSLCDYSVAKLEPVVAVTSCGQAPQSFPQAPQSSSLPLGLLVGMCNRVTCQSVRLAILSLSAFSSPTCFLFYLHMNKVQTLIHHKKMVLVLYMMFVYLEHWRECYYQDFLSDK